MMIATRGTCPQPQNPASALLFQNRNQLNCQTWVRGRRLWTRSPIGQKHAKPILENELLPPEVLCDAAEAAVPSMLRPALETLWHSGGLLGSPNYDGKGDWAPRDDC